MSLIDSTYFRNSISIPVGAYSDLTQFIEQHEKDVLILMLGYELYTEMMAAYAAFIAVPSTPLPTKWANLINGVSYSYGGQNLRWNGLINSDKVSFIAYYVYCQYLKAKQFPYQQTGAVQPKNENSLPADGIANHTAAWNNFNDLYEYCLQFLRTDTTSYPITYSARYPYTNNFGI